MKTKNTVFHVSLEVLSALVLAAMLLCIVLLWGSAPDRVAAHYDALGEVTRYGNKYELFIPPAAGIILFLLLSFLSRTPKLWNFSSAPTPENQTLKLKSTKTLLLLLKLEFTLSFFYLTLMGFLGKALSALYLPFLVISIFGTLSFYLYDQWITSRYTRTEILIDTEVTRLKSTFPVSKYVLIVPALLMAALCVFSILYQNGKGLMLVCISLFETASMVVGYFIVSHLKTRIYSEQSDINLSLNRIRIRALSLAFTRGAFTAAINGCICYLVLYGNGFLQTTSFYALFFAHIVLALLFFAGAHAKIKRLHTAVTCDEKAT